MKMIKSCTDLSQSKKLAEILPLESADMYYAGHRSIINPKEWEYGDTPKIRGKYISFDNKRIFYPCWSLAALLSVVPTIDDEFEPQLHRSLDKYRCTYEGEEDSSGLWRVADNPVDACYEMIIKLNELKML